MKLSGFKLSAPRRVDYLAIAVASALCTFIFALVSLQIQAASSAVMTVCFSMQYYRLGKRQIGQPDADDIPAKDPQDRTPG